MYRPSGPNFETYYPNFITTRVKENKAKAIENIPKNTRPYCEITEDGKYTDVCQTPAYFMQYLSAVMVKEVNGFWDFALENVYVANRYQPVVGKIIGSTIGGIQKPHYMISYYTIVNKYKG